jgi:hypothetical protein
LIRRFFLENQEKKSGAFFQRIKKLSEDIFKKSEEISESFLNQTKQESIRQFSLGEAKLSLLQTLVTWLYQASNGNNCLTSEIKERERQSKKCLKISEVTILRQEISNKYVFTPLYFTCNTILGPSFRPAEQWKTRQKNGEKTTELTEHE